MRLDGCIAFGQVHENRYRHGNHANPTDRPAESPANQPHAARGDHAGSEAAVGVPTTRSLKPVMSIDTRREEKPEPRLSRPAACRQNIRTRPFGAKVGPSTEKPSDRMRSPEPSGCMTPIEKLPASPPNRVKAMRSPRGDHTGVAYRPDPKLIRLAPPPPEPIIYSCWSPPRSELNTIWLPSGL